jgi:hypothetical protein
MKKLKFESLPNSPISLCLSIYVCYQDVAVITAQCQVRTTAVLSILRFSVEVYTARWIEYFW